MSTDLSRAVKELESALARLAPRLDLATQLDLTTHLLHLRRAAGMPARLCGPSGRVVRLHALTAAAEAEALDLLSPATMDGEPGDAA